MTVYGISVLDLNGVPASVDETVSLISSDMEVGVRFLLRL